MAWIPLASLVFVAFFLSQSPRVPWTPARMAGAVAGGFGAVAIAAGIMWLINSR